MDLSLDPFELVGFAKVGALAQGEMRVYDARIAGFWPGEGCGFVVLMRASDAVAQGRRIYALIRGWGISSDGSGGITRPEVEGQKLALERAYRRAGFGADTVGYFEGHGTGTASATPPSSKCDLVGPPLNRDSPVADSAQAASVPSKPTSATPRPPPASPGCSRPRWRCTTKCCRRASAGTNRIRTRRADDASLELSATRRAVAGRIAAARRRERDGLRRHQYPRRVRKRPSDAAERAPRRTSSGSRRPFKTRSCSCSPATSRQTLEQQVAASGVLSPPQLSFAELADLAAALAPSVETGPVRAAVVASRPAELQRSLDTLLEWIADGAEQRLDVDRGVFSATAEQPPSIGYLVPGQGTAASLDGGAWASAVSVRQATLRRRGDCPNARQRRRHGNRASGDHHRVARRTGTFANDWESKPPSASATALASWPPIIGRACSTTLALMRVGRLRAARRSPSDGQPGGAMAGIAAPAEAVEKLIGDSPVVIAGLNSPTANGHLRRGRRGAGSRRTGACGRLAGRAASVSHAFHSPLVADAVDALSPAPSNARISSRRATGRIDDHRRIPRWQRRPARAVAAPIDVARAADGRRSRPPI